MRRIIEMFTNMFATSDTGAKVQNVSNEEFAEGLERDQDAVLIDVRTEMEFDSGHLPEAKLMDMMSPSFKNSIEQLDREKSYYLYCRSGNRSYHAGRAMINKGFTKVYNLAGGIIRWNGDVTTD